MAECTFDGEHDFSPGRVSVNSCKDALAQQGNQKELLDVAPTLDIYTSYPIHPQYNSHSLGY